MSDYLNCKEIFKKLCMIDNNYISTRRNIKLASNETPKDYSAIDSLPYLTNRISNSIKRVKTELQYTNSSPKYFDETKWSMLFANQIYQINRVGNENPHGKLLIKEADEMMKDLYGIIGND